MPGCPADLPPCTLWPTVGRPLRGVGADLPPPTGSGSRAGTPPPPRCWAFPPLLLLRCGDVKPHPGPMRVALANVTSLRLHWHTVADWRADVVLITETRLTGVAQRVMRAQAGASGWQAFWGAPLESQGLYMLPLFHSSAFYPGPCLCRCGCGCVWVQNCCRGGASDLLRSTGPRAYLLDCTLPRHAALPSFPPCSRKTSGTALLSLRSFLSTAFLALFLFAVALCVCVFERRLSSMINTICTMIVASQVALISACLIQWVWVCDPSVVFIERAVLCVACRVVAVPRALPFRLQATTGSFHRPWDRMAIPWTASSCPGTRCTSAARSLCAPWP